MKHSYAGIGSRQTPRSILGVMRMIAKRLDTLGWELRSGGAKGADQAFESGSTNKDIMQQRDATLESIFEAKKYHPAWSMCSPYVQGLHARNTQIVLGRDLHTPVNMVICWTPNGVAEGGTGQAIRVANENYIPVFNLRKHLQANLDLIKELIHDLKEMEQDGIYYCDWCRDLPALPRYPCHRCIALGATHENCTKTIVVSDVGR